MKPSIPKGTRDFTPNQMYRRNYIFAVIREVFERFGYQPIETPSMETLQTLSGKYGEEGDRLLFKILNNGDFLADADQTLLSEKASNKVLSSISKRGLRYDLTVPFARYVVMHQQEINFPFKRYQIQPVWRADRPQKGRYQEFYQCDADVVGSQSLMYEAELLQIYDEVFSKLGLGVTLKINNRKILFGLAEAAGISEQFVDMTTAIDKLDKIGIEGVNKELHAKGISQEAIESIGKMLQIARWQDLSSHFENSPIGQLGLAEMQKVEDYLAISPLSNMYQFDITLARGLNYYTGCILEVKANDAQMGSIGGGGRYDNLTGVFGLPNVSGVGISFGAERIYDVLEELNLFPAETSDPIQVLVLSMDQEQHLEAFRIGASLREAGIPADIYPEGGKFKKQMQFAANRQVPYVIIIGEEELKQQKYSLKNMSSGVQQTLSLPDIIAHFEGNTDR
ncbi:MAG: histidine--tRNA ligase [Saprospiraceae bacterium]